MKTFRQKKNLSRIKQKLNKNTKLSGETEDLCNCSEARFKEILCTSMGLSTGHYYEFLFSCILYTVLVEQFEKSEIYADITEHYDAKICGIPCDFTMQTTDKKKKPHEEVVLIRFPHKSYHKGRKVKKDIVKIVLDTILDHNIPIEVDAEKLNRLNKKISYISY